MSEVFSIIQREAIYLWYYFDIQLRQILPYWAAGIMIGSVISVFGKDKIHKMLTVIQDKHLGIMGIIPSALLGIASPLCMYGTIPIAASFSQKGLRDDYLAAFMMCSVLLNPQLLIYSAALGSTALIIRFVSCFLCGITAGVLIRVFYKDKKFFNFTKFDERKSRDTDPNMFMRLLKNIGRNIKATGLWFLIGVILSAVFQRYVPAESFAG
ncbi:MAG: permease, partial [Oscillospiraceae bacterium]|nr:permease [Oscillospiraceae bacterium]